VVHGAVRAGEKASGGGVMGWPRSIPDYRWPIKPPMASAERTADAIGSFIYPRLYAAIFHLAYFIGLCTRLFCSRKDRAILIIRTDGLGDGVLSEPFIRAIAQRYVEAKIHLWAPAATCELFAGAKYVYRRQIIPRGFKGGCLEYFGSARWRWKMGWNLGRHWFDIAIYPAISPEPFGNWILSSVRAKKRWPVKGDLFHQFDWQQRATLQKASRFLAKPKAVHELDRNASLARQCGADDVERYPQLSVDGPAYEETARWISRWQTLATAAKAEGLIGVVSAGSMNQFAWPVEKWQNALTQIWHTHRLMPAFLSSPMQLNGSIPVAQLDRPISVLALAGILGEMDMVLSLDTGPAHISAAMRVPTVVLSNGGHPERFFPWPEAPWVKSLVHRMPCAGCVCRCALAEVECLTRIEVGDVMGAVGELRTRSAAQAA
jgi:ADP-heptose:LPS heptosyltransferase